MPVEAGPARGLALITISLANDSTYCKYLMFDLNGLAEFPVFLSGLRIGGYIVKCLHHGTKFRALWLT